MTKVMSGKTFWKCWSLKFPNIHPPPPPPLLFERGYSRTRGKRQNGVRTHLLGLFYKMDIQRTETCRIAMCYSLMLLYWCDWSFAYCVTSLKGVEYCPQTVFYTKWRKGGVGGLFVFCFPPLVIRVSCPEFQSELATQLHFMDVFILQPFCLHMIQ